MNAMKLVKCFKSLSVVLLLIAVSHLPAMAAIEATFVAPQEQHLGKLKALGDAFVRDRDALDTETKQKRDKIAEEKVSLHNQLVAMTDLPWDQAWHKKVAGIHALQDAAEEEDIEALRVHDDREAALSWQIRPE